jgi:outer membrane lipoprotein
MASFRLLAAALVVAHMVGCASAPPARAPAGPYPEALAEAPRSVPLGHALHWGGRIVSVRNLAERTELEVLAYPLDGDGRPQLDTTPRGRFLIDHPGFLEPAEYETGRAVSVQGRLLGYRDGEVGGAPYRFPALAPDDLRLWRGAAALPARKPRVGVGVSGGSRGTGVGISIGF